MVNFYLVIVDWKERIIVPRKRLHENKVKKRKPGGKSLI